MNDSTSNHPYRNFSKWFVCYFRSYQADICVCACLRECVCVCVCVCQIRAIVRSLHSGFGTALLPFLAMSAQASTDRALKSKSVRCCAVAGGPRSCPVDSWQRHSFLGGIRNPVRNGSHSETTRGRVKKKKEKALKSHVFMREIHSPVAETPCILHKLLLRSVSHSLRSFLSGKLADSGGSGQRTQLNSEERVPSTSQRPFLFFFSCSLQKNSKKHTQRHTRTLRTLHVVPKRTRRVNSVRRVCAL